GVDGADRGGGGVARHQGGDDVQRGATFAGGGDHLVGVGRLGGGEDLHHLGDDRPGQRSAGDDRRELPPESAVAQVPDDQVADDEGQGHRDQGGQPHQRGERGLEVHLGGVL